MVELEKIFSITYGVNLELCYLTIDDSEFAVNFVSRTKSRNGVSARVARIDGTEPNPGNTISVALTGSVLEAFYQKNEYYSGRDIAYLKPLEDMDEWTMFSYCTCIRANQYKYSYGRGANTTLAKLLVPDRNEIKKMFCKPGLPDVSTIPDYFLTEGYDKACWYLDNIDQDDFEEKYAPSLKPSIESLCVDEWGTFRLDQIFEIKKGVRLTKANQVPGDIPFIGASALNNGITGYIGQDPIHEGNTISLTYNGSVGEAYYQPSPFWASDDVNVLYLKDKTLNPYIAFFLCTVLRLEAQMWSYARKWNVEQMKQTTIKLPSDKDGNPDYVFMEDYIKGCAFSCNIA